MAVAVTALAHQDAETGLRELAVCLCEAGEVLGAVLAVGIDGEGILIALGCGMAEACAEAGSLAPMARLGDKLQVGIGDHLPLTVDVFLDLKAGAVGGAIVDDDDVGDVGQQLVEQRHEKAHVVVGGDQQTGAGACEV